MIISICLKIISLRSGMKKTTIFDYIPEIKNQNLKSKDITQSRSLDSINSPTYQKKRIEKTYIQKNLVQLLEEEEKLREIIKELDDSWEKNQHMFGYSDNEKIMIFSTIRDINAHFFNLYDFENFIRLEDEILNKDDLKEDKNCYIQIENVDYNCYYLSIALKILDRNYVIYQHKTLKLLFMRNKHFGAIICPKF